MQNGKNFSPVYIASMKLPIRESLQPQKGKNGDPGNEVDVLCLPPPPQAFLGVIRMSVECEVAERKEKVSLRVLCGFTNIFVLLFS